MGELTTSNGIPIRVLADFDQEIHGEKKKMPHFSEVWVAPTRIRVKYCMVHKKQKTKERRRQGKKWCCQTSTMPPWPVCTLYCSIATWLAWSLTERRTRVHKRDWAPSYTALARLSRDPPLAGSGPQGLLDPSFRSKTLKIAGSTKGPIPFSGPPFLLSLLPSVRLVERPSEICFSHRRRLNGRSPVSPQFVPI